MQIYISRLQHVTIALTVDLNFTLLELDSISNLKPELTIGCFILAFAGS